MKKKLLPALLKSLGDLLKSGFIKEVIVTFHKKNGRRRRNTSNSNVEVDIDVVIQSETAPSAEATKALNTAVASDIQTSQADTLADGVTVTSAAAQSQAVADPVEGL